MPSDYDMEPREAIGVGKPILLKSDQGTGKALVKSKDGRTKWLTVSADPSSPSWDEGVRRWASKLGVLALPSTPKQETPLPTPPPSDPFEKDERWPFNERMGVSNASGIADVSTAGPLTGSSGNTGGDAKRTTGRCTADKQPAPATRRASSFARGFLLGLSGGSRSRSPAKSVMEVDSSALVKAPASTLSAACGRSGGRDSDQEAEKSDGEIPVDSFRSTDTAISGRARWVKGAPSSPTSSTNGDCADLDGDENAGCVDTMGQARLAAVNTSGATSTTPRAADAPHQVTTAHDGISASDIGNDSTTCGGSGHDPKTSTKKKKKSKTRGKGNKSKKTCAAKQVGNGLPRTTKADCAENTNTRTCRSKPRASLGVKFGHIKLLEFTRDVGGCAAPGEGTWAMALGLPFRETTVDVDDYEASKAEILAERTSHLSKKQRSLSTGETRQFDHRPVGERNPIFDRLNEKDRSKLLLDYACFHKGDLEEADRDEAAGGSRQTGDYVGRGFEDSEFAVITHKVSHADFVDKSQADAIELTALRNSRRSSQGCACACIRADKLNVAKLRAEISKRGMKATGSRKDLVRILQGALQQEQEAFGGNGHKACRSDDCQCVRDGVECHADLCNCCKGPNIGKQDAHHGGNCGNPNGVYAYSSSVVRSHRVSYVTAKTAPGRNRGHTRSNSMGSESNS